MYGYIYKITCKIDNKIYIGKTTKTIKERFKEHIETSRKVNSYRHKSYLYNSMRKHGIENFSIEVIETCESEKQLNERERFWIKELNTRDPNVGYNIHEGGNGGRTQLEYTCSEKQLECLSLGWYAPMSAENKALVSKIHKGKMVGVETREKLRNAQLGKKASEETKEKMSNAHKGKKLPERSNESRERYRESSSGRVHIHKGTTNKNIKKEELDSYLNDGWECGYFYKK